MFEKEAEEYAEDFVKDKYGGSRYCAEVQKEKLFLKIGFKYGYNKANEWHYPSKGEYPKDEEFDGAMKRYYILYLGDDCVMGKYIKGSFWSTKGWLSLNEIIAWKEIVLPKESE